MDFNVIYTDTGDWLQYQIAAQWYHAAFCRGSRCATINPLPLYFNEEDFGL